MDPYAYVGDNPETVTDPTGQYYTDGNPYDRGYLESDANGDGGYYLLVYTPSNAAAPSLNDEWVNYTHFNRWGEADAVGGWAANGRPVIQCLFDCNSLSGLLAGAVVLNPEAEVACVAAPEVCAAVIVIAVLAVAAAGQASSAQTTVFMGRATKIFLPIPGTATGPNVYIPPKSGRGQPVWGTDKWGNEGWIDAQGRVWQWDPSGQAVGNPHWDVQTGKDKSHINVNPDGTINHGKDK